MKVSLYGIHDNGSVYFILDIMMGQARTSILAISEKTLNNYKNNGIEKEELFNIAERINSIDFRFFYYKQDETIIMVDIYRNFNPYIKGDLWEIDLNPVIEIIQGVKTEEQKIKMVLSRLQNKPSSIDISLLEELRYIMEFNYSLQEAIIYDMKDFDEVIEGYGFLPSQLIKIAERSDINEYAQFFQFNGYEVLTYDSVLDLFEQNKLTFARFLQFRRDEELIKPILLMMYEDIM